MTPSLQQLFAGIHAAGVPYTPRDYQIPFWTAMTEGGLKRADVVWHRRAGKDTTAWMYMLIRAAAERGVYYYLAPTYAQGKKFLWDGQTSRGGLAEDGGVHGQSFKSFIPRSWLDTTKGGGTGLIEDEMQVWLKSGSLVQIVGTDKIDNVRGANVRGAVFSEWAQSKVQSWTTLVQPMLMENGGWAVFIYTPNGQNHAWTQHNQAKDDPEWFSSLLTINETKRPNGLPVVDPSQIEWLVAAARLDRETADQEYYCSFLGGVAGAYYGQQMRFLAQNNRITRVPWDSMLPVVTWWDLGYDDATTIWFVQRQPGQVRLIDYEEHSGEGLTYYAKLIKDKQYVYSHHVMPHDIEVTELGSGYKRRDTAIKLGIKPIQVCQRHQVHEGIDAVRSLLPSCYFDAEKCATGIQALREYTKEFDAEKLVYKKVPRHDKSSHGADAFRYGAKGDFARPELGEYKQQTAYYSFDPRSLESMTAANDYSPLEMT